MEGLTEGRIVRFVASEGKIHPAIVESVIDRAAGRVNLVYFNTLTGAEPALNIPYAALAEHEKAQPGTWHWGARA